MAEQRDTTRLPSIPDEAVAREMEMLARVRQHSTEFPITRAAWRRLRVAFWGWLALFCQERAK